MEVESFEVLYAAHYSRLVAELSLVTGSWAVAEECGQEAFLRLLQRWGKLSTYDDPVGWVRRVAHRLVIDEHRRRTREVRWRSRSRHSLTRCDDYPSESWITSALSVLSPEHRQVLVLRAVEDLTVPQIAEFLAVPVGTVKSRLSRAKDALVASLEGASRDWP